jgi:hypothetical protein
LLRSQRAGRERNERECAEAKSKSRQGEPDGKKKGGCARRGTATGLRGVWSVFIMG